MWQSIQHGLQDISPTIKREDSTFLKSVNHQYNIAHRFMLCVGFSVILDPSGDRILSPSCIVDYVAR